LDDTHTELTRVKYGRLFTPTSALQSLLVAHNKCPQRKI
jgi:hypothetical protein